MGERLYILRIWRDDCGAWRASLKDPRTGEPRYFASLSGLVHYVFETFGGDAETSDN